MIVNRNTFAQRQPSSHPFDDGWGYFHFVIFFLISPAEYQALELTEVCGSLLIYGRSLEPDGDGVGGGRGC